MIYYLIALFIFVLMLPFTSNYILINAMLSAIFTSIASSIAGTYIATKNMRSMTGSLTHAILGGAGISIWLSSFLSFNIPVTAGIILTVLLSSTIFSIAHLKSKETEDAVSSAIWIIGSAAGILFASLTYNGNAQLLDILIGSLLYTGKQGLFVLAFLNIILISIFFLCRNQFALICIDENFAKTNGINLNIFYSILMLLLGLAIATISMTIGTLLSITFISIPPAIAIRHSKSINEAILKASLIAIACSAIGLHIAVITDASASACIALTVGFVYCLNLMQKKNS